MKRSEMDVLIGYWMALAAALIGAGIFLVCLIYFSSRELKLSTNPMAGVHAVSFFAGMSFVGWLLSGYVLRWRERQLRPRSSPLSAAEGIRISPFMLIHTLAFLWIVGEAAFYGVQRPAEGCRLDVVLVSIVKIHAGLLMLSLFVFGAVRLNEADARVREPDRADGIDLGPLAAISEIANSGADTVPVDPVGVREEVRQQGEAFGIRYCRHCGAAVPLSELKTNTQGPAPVYLHRQCQTAFRQRFVG